VGGRTFEGVIVRRWELGVEVVDWVVWLDLQWACRGVVGDMPMLVAGILGRDFSVDRDLRI